MGGPLDGCLAAARFDGDVARAIHRWKYGASGFPGLDVGPERLVAHLVCQAARAFPGPPPDAVVPMAIHPRRLRRRGFHAAGLLARAVAREVGAPARPDLLLRVIDTPSQTGLSPAERARNVAGAFRALPVSGAHVWLVDDVVTTGATLRAAAAALRRAGASRVAAVCAARTPPPSGKEAP